MNWVQGWLLVGVATGLGGCAGAKTGDDEGTTTVAVAEGTIVPAPDGAPVDTVNPYEGVWDVETMKGRFERAGITATETGEVRQPFMGAKGVRFRSAAGELQVFIYADAGARARDTDGLDSNEILLPGETPGGPRVASLVTGNNLAVIVIGGDSTLRHSVASVLRSRGH